MVLYFILFIYLFYYIYLFIYLFLLGGRGGLRRPLAEPALFEFEYGPHQQEIDYRSADDIWYKYIYWIWLLDFRNLSSEWDA